MRANYKLSPHFSFYELTQTLHDEFEVRNRDEITDEEEGALKTLCETLLEPVRALFGLAVIIHSGYRCEALNKKVGGSPTSQHRLGQAADFHVQGLDDAAGQAHVFERIAASGMAFGQLIDEYNGRARWIHISLGFPFRSRAESGELLRMRFVDGQTTYMPLKRGVPWDQPR